MAPLVDAPTLLLDVLIKASLLLIMVSMGSLIIRKRSAAARHRWWTLGFVGCLVIPIVSLLTPVWTPPIIPALMQTAIQSNEQSAGAQNQPQTPNVAIATAATTQVAGSQRRPTIASDSHPHQASLEKPTMLPAVNKSVANGTTSGPASENKRSSLSTSLGQILGILWAVGVALFWVRSLRQQWLLNRMLNRCSELEGPQWTGLLTEALSMIGLNRNVKLLAHPQALSPVTAGIWRPVIIFPNDANDWSHDRRRLVLLHELAHVARRDVLAQAISGLGCGLLWFHPLAWYGLSQMRKLRELACDDLVIACGQKPTGYADVLLDIARSYQHRSYASAVGMAHRHDVENRIMAILDETRRRVTLSRSAARMLFVFAAAAVTLIGTARFHTQAQTPDPPETSAAAEESRGVADSSNDKNLRSIKIKILDEQGNPLPGAKLHAGFYKGPSYRNHTERTTIADANGTVVVRFPKASPRLSLCPSLPNYVSLIKYFKDLDQEGLLPEEHEFRLSKGTSIGGQIVDADGNPVEGVNVHVIAAPSQPVPKGSPIIVGTLTNSYGRPSIQTDADGRWRLNNAPAPPKEGGDLEFSLRLDHENYVSNKHTREFQRINIPAADTRRNNATTTLLRGASVRGKVIDEQGNAVSKGWVVWDDDPYFSGGNNLEGELKSDGSFSTPQLPEGEYPITIVAPGFAAQRRVLEVNDDLDQQTFQLRRGKKIKIQFVDTAGNPVPNASVKLGDCTSSRNTWLNSNALHNHKHSGVPDYGIPRAANDKGMFEWDWAPGEPVRYYAYGKGFTANTSVLVPKDTLHVITLSGDRIVEGAVTDSVTGKAIKDYVAMPVIEFSPDFFSTRFTDRKQGVGGDYKLLLTGGGDTDSRYRVRFEAPGYRSVLSEESFGPLDGRVLLDMQLQPAPARKGVVLDPEGNPLEGANIIVGSPSWVPHTDNGEATDYDAPVQRQSPSRIWKTDSEGRFSLNATTEPIRVRAYTKTGMVEKLLQPGDHIGTMQIQRWAKVSGRLVQDGKPVADQRVAFYQLTQRGILEARFQDSYSAITAEDGTFSLDRLPPITGTLHVKLSPWRDSPLTSAMQLPLQLKAGELREINFGGDGALITGQVVTTGRKESPLDQTYSLNYLISRERSISQLPDDFPNLSFDPSGPMELSWLKDPHFDDWRNTRLCHFVKPSPDGQIRVHGVAPGAYDLLIQLYEEPSGCLIEPVGTKLVPVEVKDDGTINLGRVEVPCRFGPLPGNDMRDFEFVDADGQKQFIDDLKGQHLLMHGWATWCQPCMATMPEIQQAVAEFADQKVTFIGLNLDDDSNESQKIAKAMVKEKGWNWAQNYLGTDSLAARTLGISSVPKYFLIGPDGKLIASANKWAEIKKQLVPSLATKQNDNQ